jgi:hypothetical protein
MQDYCFTTVAALQAATIPTTVQFLYLAGYYNIFDGGQAHYVSSVTQPSHLGALQSADGRWWELAEKRPNALHFGAKDNGSATDDTAALNRMASYCNAKGLPGRLPGTLTGFSTNGPHTFNFGFLGDSDGSAWGCILFVTHATNNIIISMSNSPGCFSGIRYVSSTPRTSGAYITIDAATGTTAYHPIIEKNVFQNV